MVTRVPCVCSQSIQFLPFRLYCQKKMTTQLLFFGHHLAPHVDLDAPGHAPRRDRHVGLSPPSGPVDREARGLDGRRLVGRELVDHGEHVVGLVSEERFERRAPLAAIRLVPGCDFSPSCTFCSLFVASFRSASGATRCKRSVRPVDAAGRAVA
jgi:hypothetical protein